MTVQMTMEEYKDLEHAKDKLVAVYASVVELNNIEGVTTTDIYNFFMKHFNVSLHLRGYV